MHHCCLYLTSGRHEHHKSVNMQQSHYMQQQYAATCCYAAYTRKTNQLRSDAQSFRSCDDVRAFLEFNPKPVNSLRLWILSYAPLFSNSCCSLVKFRHPWRFRNVVNYNQDFRKIRARITINSAPSEQTLLFVLRFAIHVLNCVRRATRFLQPVLQGSVTASSSGDRDALIADTQAWSKLKSNINSMIKTFV